MNRVWMPLCLALAFIVGCGGGGGDTARVRGKVTVAGQPMENVAVTFTPSSGRPAVGVTDASGSFSLSTFDAGDGAVPGTHQVSFSYSSSEPPPSDAPPPTGPPKMPFKSKYVSGATSGITAEVVGGKVNEFNWDLEQ